MTTLSDVLQAQMRRVGVGAQTLSKLTSVPRTAIDNWRGGVVRRPRRWQPLLRIAQVLALSPGEVDELLAAAGHPPVAQLAELAPPGHPDRVHLAPWLAAGPADAVATAGPVMAAAARHQVRAPVADFAGRAGVIDDLLAHLRETGRGPVAGIRGMGGVGKTELAMVVADRLRDSYPDAQLVLDLRGASASPVPAAAALRQVLHALAPHQSLPQDSAALRACYRSVLYGKRVLIVADDARDAAQVRPLLPPAGTALLVTSRLRFSVPGMTTVDLDPLTVAEAAGLVQAISGRLSAAQARLLAQVTGGLPLALRVSGGVLRNDPALPADRYLARVADQRQRLRHLRDPDDADLDVAACLELSYQLLDQPTRRVFHQLAVLVTGFTTPLAEMVVAAPVGLDVATALHRLLRRNLISYDTRRHLWHLHDLLRCVALRHLTHADDIDHDALHRRYARAAVSLSQQVHEDFGSARTALDQVLDRFDKLRPHLDAARCWAAAHAGTHDADTLLVADGRLAAGIAGMRYHTEREWLPALRRATAAATRLEDRQSAARLANLRGLAVRRTAGAVTAAAVFRRALHLARDVHDRYAEAATLTNLANTYRILGDPRRALRLGHQALRLHRALNRPREAGLTLNNLGIVWWELGNWPRAITLYRQWLDTARMLKDDHGQAMALTNLGLAYASLGRADRAVTIHRRAMQVAGALGNANLIGVIVGNLGQAYAELGDAARALDAGGQALVAAQAAADPWEQADACLTLGRGYAQRGAHARAHDLFGQALRLFDSVGYDHGAARCRWHYGVALVRVGQIHQGRALLRAAVAHQRRVGHLHAAAHAAALGRRP